MNLNAVVPVSEAASRLGCSPTQIRSLIRTGELPATRVGHQWFVEEDAVRQTCLGNTYSGRPLSQRLAWSLLLSLQGRAPLHPLHRQEQARMNNYFAQPHSQLCHRLKGRASFKSLSATSASIGRLRADQRWVAGGGEAAARHLGVGKLPGPATFYAQKSLEEDFLDVSLAVPDAFQPNLYLGLIDDIYWPFEREIDHYAWGSVAYLDCLEQRIECPQLAFLWPPLDGNLDEHREAFGNHRISEESAVI